MYVHLQSLVDKFSKEALVNQFHLHVLALPNRQLGPWMHCSSPKVPKVLSLYCSYFWKYLKLLHKTCIPSKCSSSSAAPLLYPPVSVPNTQTGPNHGLD